ncbi:hypothetical protein Fmac_009999 [Flemingia macrophylla]|uniref:Uncharacterized protein n=1 Tax=Flemingia macrophylla TaxID=520843 RepID=A0ABD1N1Y3_9FABA
MALNLIICNNIENWQATKELIQPLKKPNPFNIILSIPILIPIAFTRIMQRLLHLIAKLHIQIQLPQVPLAPPPRPTQRRLLARLRHHRSSIHSLTTPRLGTIASTSMNPPPRPLHRRHPSNVTIVSPLLSPPLGLLRLPAPPVAVVGIVLRRVGALHELRRGSIVIENPSPLLAPFPRIPPGRARKQRRERVPV